VDTLSSNTEGSNNVANGVAALEYNSTGFDNTANGYAALYANTTGSENTAHGAYALISLGDGNYNTAEGSLALESLTNGDNNIALGYGAADNITSGHDNIALGFEAGSGISEGSDNIDIGNDGAAADTGIIRIGTQGTHTATYLTGTVYVNGIALASDRDAKENFIPVNSREVLARVAALPVTQWNYKADSRDVQHIGPMAQDFQAAFPLSADDKHISVVDEGGVALAAIQGLNQKVEEKEARIQEQAARIQNLQQQNDSLARRLNDLETTVKRLAAQVGSQN